jgi:hypothetical protein
MSFWIGPSGKIILRNGKALISATAPCCCYPPAPSQCPCGTWPGDSSGFPCGGLLYQYALASWTADLMYYEEASCETLTTWIQWRIDPDELPLNLPAAFIFGPCVWQGPNVGIQCRSYNTETGTWSSWAFVAVSDPQILLSGTNGWVFMMMGFGAYKPVGQDPVGMFRLDSGCQDGTPPSRIIVTAEIT